MTIVGLFGVAVCAVLGGMVGRYLAPAITRLVTERSEEPSPDGEHEIAAMTNGSRPSTRPVAVRADPAPAGFGIVHDAMVDGPAVAQRRASVRSRAVGPLTAALFGALAWRLGACWELPAYLALAAFLVVLSFVDLDTKRLPTRTIYAAAVTGVALLVPAALFADEPARIGWAMIGAGASLVAMGILWFLARGGFGFGDVRLGALIGGYVAWEGLRWAPAALFLAFVLSAVVGIVLMGARRAGRRAEIPFGPFLAAAALLVILVGQPLVTTVWPY